MAWPELKVVLEFYFVPCLELGAREGGKSIIEYLMNLLSQNIFNYGPLGKRFEPTSEATSFWRTWDYGTMKWECQEVSKILKENCKKMSEKTSGGDGLVEVEPQGQVAKMCSPSKHTV